MEEDGEDIESKDHDHVRSVPGEDGGQWGFGGEIEPMVQGAGEEGEEGAARAIHVSLMERSGKGELGERHTPCSTGWKVHNISQYQVGG